MLNYQSVHALVDSQLHASLRSNIMSDNDNIVAELVTDEESRINFLPSHFGSSFLKLENLVYDLAQRFSINYQGGYWHFYHLSNGAGYLAPDKQEYFDLDTPNGFSGRVNSNIFGIIVSLYAINWLANETGEELLCEQYYSLRDFAYQGIHRKMIHAAID